LKKLLLIITILIATISTTLAQGNGANNGGGNKFGLLGVNMTQVAILKLAGTNGTSIDLALNAPDEAGEMVDLSDAVDSSIWVNYTHIKGKHSRPKVDVYAKITNGTVPGGMELKVKALNDVGAGAGNTGNPEPEITLSGTDQKLIKNIHTCYTGSGPNKGHQLVYRLDVSGVNYANLDFDESTTLTIEYTITD
jgi:hypothetical protein